MCLRLARLPEPQPEDFGFWLDLFSDWEIVVLVSRMAPASRITVEYVAGLRERMARPVRVLSSVSERAGVRAA